MKVNKVKYSRNLVIALLGTDCFESSQVNKLRSDYQIELNENLDILSVLLFFYLFQPKFRPNQFLQFLCGIEEITDLKHCKERFRTALDKSFDQLSNLKIAGNSFLTYEKIKTRYRYEINPVAKQLEKFFICDIKSQDFWVDMRRGVSVGYMGAYIYLLGICGKSEIDLNYLTNQQLIKDFDNGILCWKKRNILKNLMISFSNKGVFKYGKRLEHGSVLHVKPNKSQSGFHFQTKVKDIVVTPAKKTIWLKGKPIAEEPIIKDNYTPRKDLENTIDYLNSQNQDIRLNGKMLFNEFYLEFENSSMNKLVKFATPVSKIKRSDWKNITFGERKSSLIEIEFFRTLYLKSCLKKTDPQIKTHDFLNKTPEHLKNLVVDIALGSLFQYSDSPVRSRQSFRSKLFKYTKLGITKREINSLFYFLTDRFFKIPQSHKTLITNDGYIRTCFLTYFGAVQRLLKYIPMIVTETGVIVPEGSENAVLQALSDSYRDQIGDKRIPTFRVTNSEGKKRFKFTTLTKMKEIE